MSVLRSVFRILETKKEKAYKYKQQVEVDWMFVPVHGQGQQENQRAQGRNQNHGRTEEGITPESDNNCCYGHRVTGPQS